MKTPRFEPRGKCLPLSGAERRAPARAGRAHLALMPLFLMWAFLASLNEVLVADLRSTFHLSFGSASLLQVIFYCSCLASSPLAGHWLERSGHNRSMGLGLCVMAGGAIAFVAASAASSFGLFLLASAIMACGSTLLQTAAAPYVSLLGPAERAASRFSVALGFSSLGAMLAPLAGSWLILTADPAPAARALALQHLYLLVCVALLALAVVVTSARLPPLGAASIAGTRANYRDLLRVPRFLWGLLAMVLYVGAETSIASFLINYLNLPTTLGVSTHQAAHLASLYAAGAMLLRFSLVPALARYAPSRMLLLASAGALLAVICSVLLSGTAAAWCMLAVGCFNSVIVPIVFTVAIADLGPLTSKASSMLVAALIGGAIIPWLQGSLADHFGLRRSFLLPALCYAVIAAYALYLLRQNVYRAKA